MKLVDAVGEDDVLFEIDFPHPTRPYPAVQHHIAESSRDWSESHERTILQHDAAKRYGTELARGRRPLRSGFRGKDEPSGRSPPLE